MKRRHEAPMADEDRECLERFLKIEVRRITLDEGVVSGILLVTPNAVMFDPNVTDPLVMERGTEPYSLTVKMDTIARTAIFCDFVVSIYSWCVYCLHILLVRILSPYTPGAYIVSIYSWCVYCLLVV
jgi:hypothetical protein